MIKKFNQENKKRLIPHLVAIITFLAVAVVYFQPSLEGKKLNQTDIIKGKGMNNQTFKYNKTHDDVALWNDYMFSGMPVYQIGCKYWSNFQYQVRNIFTLWIDGPIGYFMLYALGFYILMLVLGVNPWVGIAGALAFAFSSYNFIIIEAGHIWKVRTIAFMAPTFAGFILVYRKNYIPGLVLAAFFLSLQLYSNHLQMTYYMFLMVGIYIMYELIEYVKRKEIKQFLVATGIFMASLVIAIGINADRLWTTYEYSKYTIRGESELTLNKEDKSKGLDRSYITDWSYGIEESLTFLIPDTKGGASGYLAENKDALNKADSRMQQQIAQQSKYWGNQPFTSGPVYFGAIVMFLFILGMFILKDKIKWPLLIATIFSLFLSWGKNFMPLTDLFIDYFPLYNKFRAVASILVVAGLTVPVIAIMALNKAIKKPEEIKNNIKALYWSFGLTGGVAIVLYFLPDTFLSFLSAEESNYFDQLSQSNPQQADGIRMFISNLTAVRVDIFKSDAIRSFIFVILGAGSIYMYSKGILKKGVILFALPALILIDMFPINKRYLNNDDFTSKQKVRNTFTKSKADNFILKQKDIKSRVVNIGINPFTETFTSYFHHSIGGYHGAKLKRYQELIEYQLSGEISNLRSIVSNKPTREKIDNALRASQSLNMLNTKYLIYHNEAAPITNPYTNGNAWIVNNFKIVDSANQEILAIGDTDLSNTLIVDKRHIKHLKGIQTDTTPISPDETIELTSSSPNELKYSFNVLKDRIAVFSEIYYPAGWNAYIDGKPAEYFRGNYLLRCIRLPKGTHNLEFKFEPVSYFAGKRISQVSTVVFLLLLLAIGYQQWKKTYQTEAKSKK